MRTDIVMLGTLALVLVPGWLADSAAGEEAHKLSAREIFYSAPKVAAKRHRTATRKTTPPHRTKQEVAVAKPAKPVITKPEPAPSPRPVPPAPAKEPSPFIQAVADTTPELPPLGLRYSILKRVGSSDVVEVDPDITFRAGDRIRIRVEANDAAYLYIVHRGSSGVWKPLFPSPEVADGNNLVEPGRSYDIPRGYVFTFDEQPGVEKLFLVLSRTPEKDLENLIYKLSRGEVQQQEAAPEHPRPAPKTKLLMAMNHVNIGDDLVDRLRNAYSRDLIIEKVDQSTAGPEEEKENAVYAVAPSGKPDSRVVVDISLNHR